MSAAFDLPPIQYPPRIIGLPTPEAIAELGHEAFRAGCILKRPLIDVMGACELDGFKPKAGVGDRGNPHGYIELFSELWYRDQKRLVIVKPGFVCDGASVPNLVWSFIDANAIDIMVAGILHDKLYRIGAQMLDIRTGQLRDFDKSDADKVLSKVAKLYGCDSGDARHIWAGVAAFGGSSWQRKDEGWRPQLAA